MMTIDPRKPQQPPVPEAPPATPLPEKPITEQPAGEIGGQAGPEPTRYGDWEKGGRCTDF